MILFSHSTVRGHWTCQRSVQNTECSALPLGSLSWLSALDNLPFFPGAAAPQSPLLVPHLPNLNVGDSPISKILGSFLHLHS